MSTTLTEEQAKQQEQKQLAATPVVPVVTQVPPQEAYDQFAEPIIAGRTRTIVIPTAEEEYRKALQAPELTEKMGLKAKEDEGLFTWAGAKEVAGFVGDKIADFFGSSTEDDYKQDWFGAESRLENTYSSYVDIVNDKSANDEDKNIKYNQLVENMKGSSREEKEMNAASYLATKQQEMEDAGRGVKDVKDLYSESFIMGRGEDVTNAFESKIDSKIGPYFAGLGQRGDIGIQVLNETKNVLVQEVREGFGQAAMYKQELERMGNDPETIKTKLDQYINNIVNIQNIKVNAAAYMVNEYQKSLAAGDSLGAQQDVWQKAFDDYLRAHPEEAMAVTQAHQSNMIAQAYTQWRAMGFLKDVGMSAVHLATGSPILAGKDLFHGVKNLATSLSAAGTIGGIVIGQTVNYLKDPYDNLVRPGTEMDIEWSYDAIGDLSRTAGYKMADEGWAGTLQMGELAFDTLWHNPSDVGSLIAQVWGGGWIARGLGATGSLAKYGLGAVTKGIQAESYAGRAVNKIETINSIIQNSALAQTFGPGKQPLLKGIVNSIKNQAVPGMAADSYFNQKAGIPYTDEQALVGMLMSAPLDGLGGFFPAMREAKILNGLDFNKVVDSFATSSGLAKETAAKVVDGFIKEFADSGSFFSRAKGLTTDGAIEMIEIVKADLDEKFLKDLKLRINPEADNMMIKGKMITTTVDVEKNLTLTPSEEFTFLASTRRLFSTVGAELGSSWSIIKNIIGTKIDAETDKIMATKFLEHYNSMAKNPRISIFSNRFDDLLDKKDLTFVSNTSKSDFAVAKKIRSFLGLAEDALIEKQHTYLFADAVNALWKVAKVLKTGDKFTVKNLISAVYKGGKLTEEAKTIMSAITAISGIFHDIKLKNKKRAGTILGDVFKGNTALIEDGAAGGLYLYLSQGLDTYKSIMYLAKQNLDQSDTTRVTLIRRTGEVQEALHDVRDIRSSTIATMVKGDTDFSFVGKAEDLIKELSYIFGGHIAIQVGDNALKIDKGYLGLIGTDEGKGLYKLVIGGLEGQETINALKFLRQTDVTVIDDKFLRDVINMFEHRKILKLSNKEAEGVSEKLGQLNELLDTVSNLGTKLNEKSFGDDLITDIKKVGIVAKAMYIQIAELLGENSAQAFYKEIMPKLITNPAMIQEYKKLYLLTDKSISFESYVADKALLIAAHIKEFASRYSDVSGEDPMLFLNQVLTVVEGQARKDGLLETKNPRKLAYKMAVARERTIISIATDMMLDPSISSLNEFKEIVSGSGVKGLYKNVLNKILGTGGVKTIDDFKNNIQKFLLVRNTSKLKFLEGILDIYKNSKVVGPEMENAINATSTEIALILSQNKEKAMMTIYDSYQKSLIDTFVAISMNRFGQVYRGAYTRDGETDVRLTLASSPSSLLDWVKRIKSELPKKAEEGSILYEDFKSLIVSDILEKGILIGAKGTTVDWDSFKGITGLDGDAKLGEKLSAYRMAIIQNPAYLGALNNVYSQIEELMGIRTLALDKRVVEGNFKMVERILDNIFVKLKETPEGTDKLKKMLETDAAGISEVDYLLRKLVKMSLGGNGLGAHDYKEQMLKGIKSYGIDTGMRIKGAIVISPKHINYNSSIEEIVDSLTQSYILRDGGQLLDPLGLTTQHELLHVMAMVNGGTHTEESLLQSLKDFAEMYTPEYKVTNANDMIALKDLKKDLLDKFTVLKNKGMNDIKKLPLDSIMQELDELQNLWLSINLIDILTGKKKITDITKFSLDGTFQRGSSLKAMQIKTKEYNEAIKEAIDEQAYVRFAYTDPLMLVQPEMVDLIVEFEKNALKLGKEKRTMKDMLKQTSLAGFNLDNIAKEITTIFNTNTLESDVLDEKTLKSIIAFNKDNPTFKTEILNLNDFDKNREKFISFMKSNLGDTYSDQDLKIIFFNMSSHEYKVVKKLEIDLTGETPRFSAVDGEAEFTVRNKPMVTHGEKYSIGEMTPLKYNSITNENDVKDIVRYYYKAYKKAYEDAPIGRLVDVPFNLRAKGPRLDLFNVEKTKLSYEDTIEKVWKDLGMDMKTHPHRGSSMLAGFQFYDAGTTIKSYVVDKIPSIFNIISKITDKDKRVIYYNLFKELTTKVEEGKFGGTEEILLKMKEIDDGLDIDGINDEFDMIQKEYGADTRHQQIRNVVGRMSAPLQDGMGNMSKEIHKDLVERSGYKFHETPMQGFANDVISWLTKKAKDKASTALGEHILSQIGEVIYGVDATTEIASFIKGAKTVKTVMDKVSKLKDDGGAEDFVKKELVYKIIYETLPSGFKEGIELAREAKKIFRKPEMRLGVPDVAKPIVVDKHGRFMKMATSLGITDSMDSLKAYKEIFLDMLNRSDNLIGEDGNVITGETKKALIDKTEKELKAFEDFKSDNDGNRRAIFNTSSEVKIGPKENGKSIELIESVITGTDLRITLDMEKSIKGEGTLNFPLQFLNMLPHYATKPIENMVMKQLTGLYDALKVIKEGSLNEQQLIDFASIHFNDQYTPEHLKLFMKANKITATELKDFTAEQREALGIQLKQALEKDINAKIMNTMQKGFTVPGQRITLTTLPSLISKKNRHKVFMSTNTVDAFIKESKAVETWVKIDDVTGEVELSTAVDAQKEYSKPQGFGWVKKHVVFAHRDPIPDKGNPGFYIVEESSLIGEGLAAFGNRSVIDLKQKADFDIDKAVFIPMRGEDKDLNKFFDNLLGIESKDKLSTFASATETPRSYKLVNTGIMADLDIKVRKVPLSSVEAVFDKFAKINTVSSNIEKISSFVRSSYIFLNYQKQVADTVGIDGLASLHINKKKLGRYFAKLSIQMQLALDASKPGADEATVWDDKEALKLLVTITNAPDLLHEGIKKINETYNFLEKKNLEDLSPEDAQYLFGFKRGLFERAVNSNRYGYITKKAHDIMIENIKSSGYTVGEAGKKLQNRYDDFTKGFYNVVLDSSFKEQIRELSYFFKLKDGVNENNLLHNFMQNKVAFDSSGSGSRFMDKEDIIRLINGKVIYKMEDDGKTSKLAFKDLLYSIVTSVEDLSANEATKMEPGKWKKYVTAPSTTKVREALRTKFWEKASDEKDLFVKSLDDEETKNLIKLADKDITYLFGHQLEQSGKISGLRGFTPFANEANNNELGKLINRLSMHGREMTINNIIKDINTLGEDLGTFKVSKGVSGKDLINYIDYLSYMAIAGNAKAKDLLVTFSKENGLVKLKNHIEKMSFNVSEVLAQAKSRLNFKKIFLGSDTTKSGKQVKLTALGIPKINLEAIIDVNDFTSEIASLRRKAGNFLKEEMIKDYLLPENKTKIGGIFEQFKNSLNLDDKAAKTLRFEVNQPNSISGRVPAKLKYDLPAGGPTGILESKKTIIIDGNLSINSAGEIVFEVNKRNYTRRFLGPDVMDTVSDIYKEATGVISLFEDMASVFNAEATAKGSVRRTSEIFARAYDKLSKNEYYNTTQAGRDSLDVFEYIGKAVDVFDDAAGDHNVSKMISDMRQHGREEISLFTDKIIYRFLPDVIAKMNQFRALYGKDITSLNIGFNQLRNNHKLSYAQYSKIEKDMWDKMFQISHDYDTNQNFWALASYDTKTVPVGAERNYADALKKLIEEKGNGVGLIDLIVRSGLKADKQIKTGILTYDFRSPFEALIRGFSDSFNIEIWNLKDADLNHVFTHQQLQQVLRKEAGAGWWAQYLSSPAVVARMFDDLMGVPSTTSTIDLGRTANKLVGLAGGLVRVGKTITSAFKFGLALAMLGGNMAVGTLLVANSAAQIFAETFGRRSYGGIKNFKFSSLWGIGHRFKLFEGLEFSNKAYSPTQDPVSLKWIDNEVNDSMKYWDQLLHNGEPKAVGSWTWDDIKAAAKGAKIELGKFAGASLVNAQGMIDMLAEPVRKTNAVAITLHKLGFNNEKEFMDRFARMSQEEAMRFSADFRIRVRAEFMKEAGQVGGTVAEKNHIWNRDMRLPWTDVRLPLVGNLLSTFSAWAYSKSGTLISGLRRNDPVVWDQLIRLAAVGMFIEHQSNKFAYDDTGKRREEDLNVLTELNPMISGVIGTWMTGIIGDDIGMYARNSDLEAMGIDTDGYNILKYNINAINRRLLSSFGGPGGLMSILTSLTIYDDLPGSSLDQLEASMNVLAKRLDGMGSYYGLSQGDVITRKSLMVGGMSPAQMMFLSQDKDLKRIDELNRYDTVLTTDYNLVNYLGGMWHDPNSTSEFEILLKKINTAMNPRGGGKRTLERGYKEVLNSLLQLSDTWVEDGEIKVATYGREEARLAFSQLTAKDFKDIELKDGTLKRSFVSNAYNSMVRTLPFSNATATENFNAKMGIIQVMMKNNPEVMDQISGLLSKGNSPDANEFKDDLLTIISAGIKKSGNNAVETVSLSTLFQLLIMQDTQIMYGNEIKKKDAITGSDFKYTRYQEDIKSGIPFKSPFELKTLNSEEEQLIKSRLVNKYGPFIIQLDPDIASEISMHALESMTKGSRNEGFMNGPKADSMKQVGKRSAMLMKVLNHELQNNNLEANAIMNKMHKFDLFTDLTDEEKIQTASLTMQNIGASDWTPTQKRLAIAAIGIHNIDAFSELFKSKTIADPYKKMIADTLYWSNGAITDLEVDGLINTIKNDTLSSAAGAGTKDASAYPRIIPKERPLNSQPRMDKPVVDLFKGIFAGFAPQGFSFFLRPTMQLGGAYGGGNKYGQEINDRAYAMAKKVYIDIKSKKLTDDYNAKLLSEKASRFVKKYRAKSQLYLSKAVRSELGQDRITKKPGVRVTGNRWPRG